MNLNLLSKEICNQIGFYVGKKDAPVTLTPTYDATEYIAFMHTAVADALSRDLGTMDDHVHQRLLHFGNLLDADIDKVQAALSKNLEDNNDGESACQLAWDTFALVRRRCFFQVPSATKPLIVHAKPIQNSW